MTRPRQKSRADQDFYDFNTPCRELAAKAVTQEQLETLFDALDRADEQFPGDPGKATKKALHAVIKFVCASPLNSNGRFSRPLELLYAQGGRALIWEKGSGGVNVRKPEHHIRAAAAFVVSQLVASGLTREVAAARVAPVLAAARFPFGKRRANPANTILAWRRDYARKTDNSAAGRAYKEYAKNPPVVFDGDTKTRERAALKWLSALLGRASYGDVA
jgi:hypothetical protein